MKLFANILLITLNQVSLCKFSWCTNTEGNQIQPSYGTPDINHTSYQPQVISQGFLIPLHQIELDTTRASEGVLGKQSNGSRFHK